MKLIDLHSISSGTSLHINNKNFHLYYVPKGVTSVLFEEETILNAGDLYALNPEEAHTIRCEEGICIDFEISYSRVLQLMGYQRKVIVCRTSKTQNENAAELARTAERLIRAHYEAGTNQILQEQYALQLVYQLISNYSNNVFSASEDQRKSEIESYIEANYASDMTLEEIASEFGLTPQYFSRYFRETFQITFLRYLNQIRLTHAAEELLDSDETALRIAVNNGFPNPASFLREFRSVYGITPSDYRKQHRSKTPAENADSVLSFLSEETGNEKHTDFLIDVTWSETFPQLNPYWRQLLNVGSFTLLMKNGVMDQVRYLQERLKFSTARLKLDTYSEDGKHKFYITDSVIDFLIRLRMKFIIVIDFRFIDEEERYLSYFRDQCQRLSRRFGESVQSPARFELMYDTDFDTQKLNSYRTFYECLSSILNECGFDPNLLGPGILIDESGENFRLFIRNNPGIKTFTFTSAPYSFRHKGSEVFINRLTDSGYLLEQFQTAMRILNEERPDASGLLVSWKDRLNDVDVLNETPYMGARIIHNVLSGYSILTSLPLDLPLDLLFDELTFDKTFNGLPGILTTKGLRKPSFHALALLEHQDSLLVEVSPDYLVTASKQLGYFQILCHNCKKPGYKYYMNDTVEDFSLYQEDLFEDQEVRNVRITFHDLIPGSYLLKTRIINDEAGCAFTRYLTIRYENDTYFGHGEEEYLKAAAVIPMEGETLQTNENRELIISFTLKPNEFRHLHLLRIKS